MNFLIDIYDNSLIYYPNIFFPLLFLLGILGIIVLIKLIVFLSKESKKISKEIKILLSKIKIKKKERIKISRPKFLINIYYLIKFMQNLMVKISNTSTHLKLKIDIIIAKIKKEVLVD